MDSSKFPKRFSIYDPYTTVVLPIGILLLCGLSIGLSAFFIFKFVISTFNPISLLLIGVLLGPWIYIFIAAYQNGLIERLTIRLAIDSSGIHCYKFGRRQFSFFWDEIHTYGILNSSFSYADKKILLFSLNKREYAPKNNIEINTVSSERIILQYRNDLWLELRCYMPTDMKAKLDYSLLQNESCFHKR